MPATPARFGLRPFALGAIALGALCNGPSWAHGIQSNLENVSPLSEQVRSAFQLQSEFSSGEPAGDAAVRLWRPDGETIEMGRTDAQGRLRFELPGELSDGWELQVDAGPGHRDYLELPEAGGGRSLQDGGQATAHTIGRGGLLSWRSTGLGRLLAQRPALAALPLVGGLAMGLSAVGVILFQRRRR